MAKPRTAVIYDRNLFDLIKWAEDDLCVLEFISPGSRELKNLIDALKHARTWANEYRAARAASETQK